jgi:peptidoglycan-associated lipoprotein
MNRNKHWILALAAAAFLAGCASGVKLDTPAPVVDRSATPAAAPAPAPAPLPAAAPAPAPESRVAPVAAAPAETQVAGPTGVNRLVYFDYDSFVIKPEFQALIEGHARFLKANPSRKIAIEGHTDERGGREYNLALGQKRAEAVRRALGLLGVTDAQLEAVSFGKEKPANSASTEAAYADNRRAEIVYR